MKKNLKIIKQAALGKAGASVFSKLAIDDLGTLNKDTGKPEPKPEPKKVEPVKPDVKAKIDSIKKVHLKTDPIFKAKMDSLNAVAKADSLAQDKAFKSELRKIEVADSLRNAANREAFVQDSTNYGGIIARIKRTLGL